MHSKTIDLARTASCWHEDADNESPLDPPLGLLLAVIVSVPVWCLLGLLVALAIRWTA